MIGNGRLVPASAALMILTAAACGSVTPLAVDGGAGAGGTSASGTAGTSASGTAGTSASGTAGTSASGTAGTSASGTAGTSASGTAGTSGAGGAGGAGGPCPARLPTANSGPCAPTGLVCEYG